MSSKGTYLSTRAKEPNTLDVYEYIQSPSKKCHMVMRPDGVLSVARGESPETSEGIIWTSGPAPQKCGPYNAILQEDGNFVVYGDARRAAWATGRYDASKKSGYHVELQDDGELCVFTGEAPGERRVTWWNSGAHDERSVRSHLWQESTMEEGERIVSPNRVYSAGLQHGGRLVVVRGEDVGDDTKVVWSTNLPTVAGRNVLTMTGQSWIVIRNFAAKPEGTIVWSSETPGKAGPPSGSQKPTSRDPARAAGFNTFNRNGLAMRIDDDGCLSVVSPQGTVLWNNGYCDPLLGAVLDAVEYRAERADWSAPRPRAVFTQHVRNHTSGVQNSSISGSFELTRTSTWEHRTSWKLSIVSTAKGTFFGFFEKGLDMSVERTWESAEGGSFEDKQAFSFQTPIELQPGQAGTVSVVVTEVEVTVPYALRCRLRFASGAEVPFDVEGVFHGLCARDVGIDFAVTAAGEASSVPLRRAPRVASAPATRLQPGEAVLVPK